MRPLLSFLLWLAGTLFMLTLCTACSVRRVTFNEVLTAKQVQFIHIGQTTMPDVVKQLGAPDEILESDSGVVTLYNWSDTKSAAVDFGVLPRLFLPYAPSMTLNKTGIAPEQFLVAFDPRWTVRAYGFSRWTKEEPIIWFWPF